MEVAAFTWGIDLSKAKRIINKFKKWIKLRAIANHKLRGRRKILTQHYKIRIKEFLEKSTDRSVKVRDILAMLKMEFPQLQDVSLSTVRRWMKNELNLTYKKIYKISQKFSSHENKVNMLDWMWMLRKLAEKNFEVVFCDEFSVDGRQKDLQGWGIKGRKWIAMAKSENFHWSFICGLSDKRYYSVLGVKGSTNSIIFGEFLINIKRMHNAGSDRVLQLVVVVDNASIHKSSKIKELLEFEENNNTYYYSLQSIDEPNRALH